MQVIREGSGPLFMPPDPFGFREQRRRKNRGQRSKTTTVSEAVATHAKDSLYLATGGFGTNRIPVAVLHEGSWFCGSHHHTRLSNLNRRRLPEES